MSIPKNKLPLSLKKGSTASWESLVNKRRATVQQYQSRYYSQVETMKKFQEKIQGPGGYLDQMYAFLDGKSALDWLDVITAKYTHMFQDEGFPCTWIARMVKAQLKKMGLDKTRFLEVISLGCGTAEKDSRITEILLDAMKNLEGIPFYLLDINSLLLECGIRYAEKLFQDDPRVAPISVLGNMYDINLYKEIFYSKEQNALPQVLMFLGSTLGNITDELELLRTSFGHFPSGTLLVMDYTLAFGNAQDAPAILEKDPYFSRSFPLKYMKALERFSLGPLRRYKDEKTKKLEFRPSLEINRPRVIGSYYIELNVDVTMADGSKQCFEVQRVKRYDSESLLEAIETTGWKVISGNRFAPNKEVYLFCKQ